MNPKSSHLIKKTHARFQDLIEDLLLLRIDCNFNHFVFSLVLATQPYAKVNEIEMIEDLARITHGNVRCFHNL